MKKRAFPFLLNFPYRELGFRLFPYFFGEGEIFFPLWSPGKWFFGLLTEGDPHLKGGTLLGVFSGKRLFAFSLTLENLKYLRGALPELAPEVPGKGNTAFLLEVSPSFLPEMFRILWKKNLVPCALACGEEALERGMLSAFWGAFAGGNEGPFGIAFLGGTVDLLARALQLGYTVVLLDAQNFVRSEVFSWNEKRLVDAFSSLSPREKETWKRYAGRSIRFSKDLVLTFPEEPFLRMLLAYFPLLDVLEEGFANLKAYHTPFALGVSLGNVAKEVHFFLAEELHRRGVDFAFFLFGEEAQEHLFLAQAIQGYSPGVPARDLAPAKEGYAVILEYPGFSALCDTLATGDFEFLRSVSDTPLSPPSLYEEYRNTFETLLFQFSEDFVKRLEERFA